ncbi:MAG TPA: M48 family metallopeptidase [Vicinamibacterales bacterium]|jgi:peptidase M48-like protein|nr:M48 family metallopeptidase [Vicinamibacterales bacterium]
MSTYRYKRIFVALVLTASVASAQTHIVAPTPNKYKPSDDVQVGQEAAQQAMKELPMLNDAATEEYVEGIGQRLVRSIPAEYQHPEFRYTFRVVNQKEINAFALPGGPMFVNRGMIEAAHDEGEIAGVMAHELSHVVLRHGTAQATKATKYEIGAVAGQILGAIVGGAAGSIIAQGSNFGISTYFMKFSREYESQADILGSQIMARAGYNPVDMANMFHTLAAQGGSGPEWLSDHPNPGNREQRIRQEAQALHFTGGGYQNTAEFNSIQNRLKGMSPALTAQQIANQQKTGRPVGTGGRAVNVEPPSGSFRTYQPTNALRVSVPSNWSPVEGGGSSVTYAPQGAYFQGNNGGSAFTHGVEVGVAQGTGNLQNDTNSLLRSFAQGNPNLQQSGRARNDSVGGRNGITVQLANVSEVTGQPEYIALSTTELRDGSLLYVIGVAPRTEADTYDRTFQQVRRNIQIADR